MSSRNLILAIATAAVIVAAWRISQETAPTTEIASSRLYPELIEHVNDVQRVTVETTQTNTELEKVEGGWVVANRDRFPAEFPTIKNVLLNLAELTIVEKKTSKPENYEKLAVGGVDDEDSKSLLIRVDARDGVELASLIIGNKRTGSQLDSPTYYVRKSDAMSALLVQGDLNINADPQKWINAEVVNIATERVRKVTINRNQDTPIVISKEKHGENFFDLQAIPTGFAAKSRSVVSSLGALLLDVKFQDVAAAGKVEDTLPRAIVEIQTFDGLVATLEQIDFEENVYVRFRFEFNPGIVVPVEVETDESGGENDAGETESSPSTADEVEELNARVADWVYVLPDYKVRMLDKRFDDMIKPAEPPAENAEEIKTE